MRNLCINYSLAELERESNKMFKPRKNSHYNRVENYSLCHNIEILRPLIERKKQEISQKNGIKAEMINEKTRKREIVEIRQCLHYCLYWGTRLSLSNIGFEIGKKDHATILHSRDHIEDLLQTDKSFSEMFETEFKPFIQELKDCVK